MKSALIQMVSSDNVSENLHTARKLVACAADHGAELIILPEYFSGMGLLSQDKLTWSEPLGEGAIQNQLSAWAQTHRIWLLGGSLPTNTPIETSKIRNTSTLWSPDGELVTSYDKIHLFKFESNQEQYDEAETVERGSSICIATIYDRSGTPWKIGLSICYDLRFPELYRALSLQGADIIAVPSAFTYTTGQAHWEVLIRARAIENQCWLLAAAQGGKHANGRHTWGHSMAVDPWGNIHAQATEPGEQVIYADLSREVLEQTRRQLPALKHRFL